LVFLREISGSKYVNALFTQSRKDAKEEKTKHLVQSVT
jgi:hypothetical protein